MTKRLNSEAITVVRALASSGQARAIRVDAQVPLRVIAADCSCSPASIWHWENGISKVGARFASAYLQALMLIVAAKNLGNHG